MLADERMRELALVQFRMSKSTGAGVLMISMPILNCMNISIMILIMMKQEETLRQKMIYWLLP